MIYLDNASTTPISPAAEFALVSRLKSFGNPSNFYSLGVKTHQLLDAARRTIAKCLNCSPEEIYFTSGASEGNAWALSQRANRYCSRREHHSVNDYPGCIKISGEDIKQLNENEDIKNSIIAWILVNNETGEISRVPFSDAWKDLKCLKHIDATQAIGHIPVDLQKTDSDSISFSAHKFGGPKGVGVLYINKRADYKPLIIGSQQNGMRGGTENVPGIVAMSIALENTIKREQESRQYYQELKDAALSALTELPFDMWHVNRGAANTSNILSVSFKNVSAEAVVLAMQSEDIFVGMGSACNTGNLDPSWVLTDMGVPADFIYGTIRISFGPQNTKEEVETAMRKITSFVWRTWNAHSNLC